MWGWNKLRNTLCSSVTSKNEGFFFGVCNIYIKKNLKLIWNIVRKNWSTLYRGADKSLARPGKNWRTLYRGADKSLARQGKNWRTLYRGADKSLARPGRKQSNASVRMAWISSGALPCRKYNSDDSSGPDFVEIARVPDMLPSLFPFWSG